jgi:hypothetical protein
MAARTRGVGPASKATRSAFLILPFLLGIPAAGLAQGYALSSFQGSTLGGSLGSSVARARDVNGDGVPDLVVGAPYENPGGAASTGRARVYSR